MANPFDQFDATSSAPASGANPFDQFDAKAKTAQAPSDNDYSKSPLSALGRTFESSADWGVGDLLRAAATGKKPSETAAQSSAAAASLPWYVRYPTEAAGYGLGLVNLLDPVTDAVEAGAAGLGAGATLSKIAGTAAEGATVGGVSHVAGSDDPGVMDTAGAALGGAALGGAAGAAAPLINKGLTKALGKPGTIDPATAIASTTKDRTDAYAALTAKPANPTSIDQVLGGVMNNLDPSVQTGMSPGLKSTINNIRGTVQGLPDANMGQVDSWQRQINAAAQREGHPTDAIVAGQIDSGLNGLIQGGGAGGLQEAAQQAHQKYMMAQNLAEWQRQVQAGGNLGQKPFTEAERYYDPTSPEYQTLAGLANQGGGHSFTTSALGHLGANALGAVGGALGGFPGAFVGEGIGYLYARPAIYKAMKGYDARQKLRGLQAAYPQMTGQSLTGASPGPQLPQGTGDQIKNLMLGSAY